MKALAVLMACSTLVVGSMVRDEKNQRILGEGPTCPMEDPLVRLERIPVHFTGDPFGKLLEGSYIENIHVTGLSSLHYHYRINFFLYSFGFEVSLDELQLDANYQAEGYLNAPPLPRGNFTGDGSAKINIENLYFKGRAVGKFDVKKNKIELANLTLAEVRFDKVALDFENYAIGGETVNWAKFNEHVKGIFDKAWPVYGTALSETFKQAANVYLKGYKLSDLARLYESAGDENCLVEG